MNQFEEFMSVDIEFYPSEGQQKGSAPQGTSNQNPIENEDDNQASLNNKKTGEITKRSKRGRPKKLLTEKRGRPKRISSTMTLDDSADELEDLLGFDNPSDEEYQSANLIQPTDPKTSTEALNSPEADEWRNAMVKEYNTLIKNQTWKIVERPVKRKVVKSKWVLRTKYKIDGSIECRKARLVAKGFTQHAGIDYNETFAPVARMSSIRFLTAIAAQFGLEVHQLDFVGAYLNGIIKEEIYMEMPDDLNKILDENEASKYSNKVYSK